MPGSSSFSSSSSFSKRPEKSEDEDENDDEEDCQKLIFRRAVKWFLVSRFPHKTSSQKMTRLRDRANHNNHGAFNLAGKVGPVARRPRGRCQTKPARAERRALPTPTVPQWLGFAILKPAANRKLLSRQKKSPASRPAGD